MLESVSDVVGSRVDEVALLEETVVGCTGDWARELVRESVSSLTFCSPMESFDGGLLTEDVEEALDLVPELVQQGVRGRGGPRLLS